MAGFQLEGGNNTRSYYTEEAELKFDPPVYEQRYCMTLRILEDEIFKHHIKKVADFGCAEMQLLGLLKRVPGVEEILEVDIDEELLKANMHRAKPLNCDYVCRRETPLRVNIYCGSVDSSSDCLRNIDAVIGIEIIEHLYPKVLDNVPYNVFGYIRPKVAIFSTPNAEFNILFNLTLPNGFRHDDHKFEWTRDQFQDWCHNICSRFPDYQVSFLGAGEPPPEYKNIGNVSQIGVFIRRDVQDQSFENQISRHTEKLPETAEYRLLQTFEYPVARDDRTDQEKLCDDVAYHINRHVNRPDDEFFNGDLDRYEIPMKNIFEFVCPQVLSLEELRDFLIAKKYNVEEDFILVDRDCRSEGEESMNSSIEDVCENVERMLNTSNKEENWD